MIEDELNEEEDDRPHFKIWWSDSVEMLDHGKADSTAQGFVERAQRLMKIHGIDRIEGVLIADPECL